MADYGLLGGIGAGLQNFSSAFLQSRQQRLQNELAKKQQQQQEIMNQATLEEKGYEIGPSGGLLEKKMSPTEFGLFKGILGEYYKAAEPGLNPDGISIPEARRQMTIIKYAKSGEGAKATQESGLRQQYLANSKNMAIMHDAYQKVKDAVNSPVGQLALGYGLIKAFDPGSVVREGERADIKWNASIPTRFEGILNQIRNGRPLTGKQVYDIKQTVADQYRSGLKAHKTIQDFFTNTATAHGIDPSRIVIQYPQPEDRPKAVDKYTQGKVYYKNGKGYKYLGGGRFQEQ